MSFLHTFGRKFEVYNKEMQIYGEMTVKHLFIIQATADNNHWPRPQPTKMYAKFDLINL